MLRHRICLLSFVGLAFGPYAVGQEPKRPSEQPPETVDRRALEQQFQEMLTDAVLVGSFTIAGQENEKPLQEEKYTISRVTKLQGDLWLFAARIQYGGQDVTVPLPLQVKWAGDTPVISVTDVTIPALGTFTARVMFHRGRYAGIWQHGDVGGHLWGKITKKKPESDEKTSE